MPEHANMVGTKRNMEATKVFWDIARPLLAEDGVVEGSIMNFPCLRNGKEFFGMPHHETGDAVLKLPKTRVAELIADGVGQPFGPGKKIFKEWVLVGQEHRDQWVDLLQEARAFAAK